MCNAMRRLMILVWAATCFMSAAGCIKEDRNECPCRLTLNLDGVWVEGKDSLELYVTSKDETVYSVKLDSSDISSNLMIDVPRTSLKLMAWCGKEGMARHSGLVIPLGKQCPKVYLYTADVDAQGETCCETVVMRKNHCVLSVLFKQDDAGDPILSLSGNVCGYDESGEPVVGDFYSEIIEDTAANVTCPQVVVPRQCGGEMTLHVDDGAGKVRSFPLAEYIKSAGYDWSVPDLPDMIVTIDYVLTTLSLEVLGWDEEFFFNIVI